MGVPTTFKCLQNIENKKGNELVYMRVENFSAWFSCGVPLSNISWLSCFLVKEHDSC